MGVFVWSNVDAGSPMNGERFFGQDFGPLINVNPPEPEPIPGLNLTAIPRRLKSFDLNISRAHYEVRESVYDALADVVSRVLAEDRRMRRMLPPLPPGYEWHGELQREESSTSFIRDEDKLRIVYTVREIPGRDAFD